MVTIGAYQLIEAARAVDWEAEAIKVTLKVNPAAAPAMRGYDSVRISNAENPGLYSALQDATRAQVEAYVKTKADAGDISDIAEAGSMLYELFAP